MTYRRRARTLDTTLMFEGKLARRRRAAVRVGWNNAAWGQPRHDVDADLAAWYERGYAGGLIFRQKDQQDISFQDVLVAEPPARTDMVQSRVG
jgi:hypothetical protein